MNTKQHRSLRWILGSLTILVCVGLILAAYQFGWPDTGFQGKTVWDWLQLLIIPLVLALVALVFNQTNTSTERQIAQQRYEQDRQIALDRQREDLLQSYLDRISDLLLKENLRTSQPDSEIRKVARVRTISILLQLDVKRVEHVFTLLCEAGLTKTADAIVNLRHADLRKVAWSQVDLSELNLREIYFSGADLSEADLNRADFSGADLTEANLSGANLTGANLTGANLTGANLTGANFSRATINASRLSPKQIASATF